MMIVGITGTLGAGKGTIVEYLEKEKGFQHYSVRAYLIDEMARRGLENNRDNMVVTANDLRSHHSPSFIIEELYKEASTQSENAVIESIRTPGEVEFLKSRGNFILIAVDADPRLRYERITLRKSSTDDVNYETFLANEAREFSTDDPNKQNLKKCIEMADIVLNNNGTVEDLYHQLDNSLSS
jgi:dephospho-CoA kinase